MTPRKRQLHYSHIDVLTKCGVQYERRYIRNEKTPPGIALLVGSAVHTSIERNLKQKATTGQLMSPAESQAAARDAFERSFQNEETAFTPEEHLIGEKKITGQAVDMSVRLAKLHSVEIAPGIDPISADHVERGIVLKLEDHKFDLAMTLDCQEKSGIRDCKTSKIGWSDADVSGSLQLTMYAMGVHVQDDIPYPIKVAVDNLVKLKTPKAKTLCGGRGIRHQSRLLATVDRVAEILKKGVFTPANAGWWGCSKTWCGYAATCPYWSGRP